MKRRLRNQTRLSGVIEKEVHRCIVESFQCYIHNFIYREFRIIMKRRLRNRTKLSSVIEKEVHRCIVEWFQCHASNEISFLSFLNS